MFFQLPTDILQLRSSSTEIYTKYAFCSENYIGNLTLIKCPIEGHFRVAVILFFCIFRVHLAPVSLEIAQQMEWHSRIFDFSCVVESQTRCRSSPLPVDGVETTKRAFRAGSADALSNIMFAFIYACLLNTGFVGIRGRIPAFIYYFIPEFPKANI